MAAGSLSEYLVKLGWDVDMNGPRMIEQVMSNVESKINSSGKGIIGSMVKASASIYSVGLTAASGMTSFLSSVVGADLQVRRFAREMWTTEERARSFSTAMDAIGVSMDDIFYLPPEEFNRLMELRNLGNSLQAPEGLKEGLKLVRDVAHEFNRLKVIASYATQWISFYLMKYLGKDFKNIQLMFKNFNDMLIKNMPIVTEKIAKFLAMVFQLGKAGAKAIRDITEVIGKLFNSFSSSTKQVVSITAGLIGLLTMGPIGAAIAALTAILVLLDDFYTWKEGGKAAFGDFWENITDVFSKLGADKTDGVKEAFEGLSGSILDLVSSLTELLTKKETIEAFLLMLKGLMITVGAIVAVVADTFLLLAHAIDIVSGKHAKPMSDYFSSEQQKWQAVPGAFGLPTYPMAEQLFADYFTKTLKPTATEKLFLGGGRAANVDNSTKSQTNNIEINTYGGVLDPNTAARTIQDSLTKNANFLSSFK